MEYNNQDTIPRDIVLRIARLLGPRDYSHLRICCKQYYTTIPHYLYGLSSTHVFTINRATADGFCPGHSHPCVMVRLDLAYGLPKAMYIVPIAQLAKDIMRHIGHWCDIHRIVGTSAVVPTTFAGLLDYNSVFCAPYVMVGALTVRPARTMSILAMGPYVCISFKYADNYVLFERSILGELIPLYAHKVNGNRAVRGYNAVVDLYNAHFSWLGLNNYFAEC